MKFNLFYFIASVILFCSCNNNNSITNANQENLISDSTIKYAKLFSFSYAKEYKIIHYFGKAHSNDTTANFILYSSENKPNIKLKNAVFVKTPCKRIVSLSTIYTTMLTELECVNEIIGVENIDYYNNAEVLKKHAAGLISELQRSPDINREEVIKINPDIIFAFGMGNKVNDFDSKIMEKGIPVAVCIDHLEETPLARAEWIKFFAAFVNKEKLANELFLNTEKEYLRLKKIVENFKNKPEVFTELKFGDTWFVPGGKSYISYLIKDAGAKYIWDDDSSKGSLPLSFETVYRRASKANFWLNVSMCENKNQMLEQDKRYADFEAFKVNGVYNNNLVCNSKGYSTFWETGMVFPNRILNDFILLFHPEATDSLKSTFYYYKKLY